METSIICLIAIGLCIFLGYKTKINTGLFAIVAAYIIGCFILELKGKEVIAMWPTKLFFIILSVSLFYNFAILNGTLEKLSNYLLYKSRKYPKFLPYYIFFSSLIVSALGAGYFAVIVFFSTITLVLCKKTGLNMLTGAIAVNFGTLAGNNFPTSTGGVIFRGLMDNAGYASQSYGYSFTIFVLTVIIPLLVLSIIMILSKKQKEGIVINELQKPEQFNEKQSITLKLVIAMVVIVLIPPLLKIAIPDSQTIAFIAKKVDIAFLAIIFSVLAIFLRLGDQKEAILKIPWETIIMVCGVGMLISVAIKAGTIIMLSQWIGNTFNPSILLVVVCIVAGIMSFFASTMGVVTPALFPIIPALAIATGINPAILFSAIVIGAQATSLSPFSSGGSLVLSSSEEKDRPKLYTQLMFKAVPLCLGITTVFIIILNIFI